MKIRKALITAAGFGTRFLPITKSIQKEMLPILNVPLIDYVVNDCINAGIEEIVFVISEHNKQLIHYYRENDRLYEYLKKMGKLDRYQDLAEIHQKAQFTFVKQSEDEQYGTAVPLKIAQEHFRDEEAFLVFMGDDFIYNENGDSEAKNMIEHFTKSGASSLATCIRKPEAELSKYGVAEVRQENGLTFLTSMVEKPAPGEEPSDLINISKYVFTPEIFEVITKQEVDYQSGELYITDTITLQAKSKPVVIYTPGGRYLDGGNVLEWLKSNLVVAKNTPELRDNLIEFIRQEFTN